MAWFDKRKVMVASTAHSSADGTVTRGRARQEFARPVAIQEYSKYYCGVDKSDQLRSYYGTSVKAFKWWKYLFYFCVDVSVINAYILYCEYMKARPGPHNKQLSHFDFTISVMKSLAGNFTSRQRPGKKAGQKRPAVHELTKITTKRGQRDCAHCKQQNKRTKSGKAIQTTYQCLGCGVGLCNTCYNPHHG